MPHIRARKVGDKIVVEVQLLDTRIEEQEQSKTCVAAAAAAPSAVDDRIHFNNRQVNFRLTLDSKLDCESLNANKHGCGRNADAA